MMTPEQFVQEFANKKVVEPDKVRFATIDPAYVSGSPQLLFPGESTVTLKKYKRLASYSTPAAGEKVMVFHDVILGRII